MSDQDEKQHGGRKAAWIRRHVDYQDEECLIFPFPLHKDGYGTLGLNYKVLYAHRFMCTLTHGDPPTGQHQAAHSCNRGNDGCVNPQHLSWKTPGENHKEAIWHPKIKVGVEAAKDIRDMKGIEDVSVTAERHGIAEITVRQIQAGRMWNGKGRAARLFTDAQVQRIRGLKGVRCKAYELAEEFGCSPHIIWKIMNRKTWAHVPEVSLAS